MENSPLIILSGLNSHQTVLILADLAGFIIIFSIPVLIQLLAGKKALNGNTKLKYWMVCTASIVSQILLTVSFLVAMSGNTKENEHHDTGIGALFILFEGVMMLGAILVII